MRAVPCNLLFDGWQLTSPWFLYVCYCVGAALVLRGVQSVLRAWAVQRGDFAHDKDATDTVIPKFWDAFWYTFRGFNKFKEHSDLWLQFLINVFELAAYPVLLVLDQTLLIAAWIGIRTAGGWVGWSESRTSFMRYLLVSLLVLSLSYFWLSHYVKRLACSTL